MVSFKAPFPYFGGKSKMAHVVWRAFGNVKNYVEPFFGSGAVLLGRPSRFSGLETVNDKDGFLANFWRAIKHDPEAVAGYADWPVNENDLHARHAWLIQRRSDFTARLEGNPDYYDAKIAGWWVWGICAWIGSGWCSGKGPWVVSDGLLVNSKQTKNDDEAGHGINRKYPHLGDTGVGINRKTTVGRTEFILDTFSVLSDRLRDVRVCCGNWSRVMGKSVTCEHGLTGIFLDPPYSNKANRCDNLYACDSLDVAYDVMQWCIDNEDNPLLRIVLCGYEGEHTMPDSWTCIPWKANGGYSNPGHRQARNNATRERIWLSPVCLKSNYLEIFDSQNNH